MQRDISCYEALAQLALLFVASRMWPSRRFNIRISSWSDNSGAESGVNKLFTTSYPLCIFLERLSLLSAICFAELDATHISGLSNEFADALSRWDTISLPPYGFSMQDRLEVSLHTLWFPKSEITVHPLFHYLDRNFNAGHIPHNFIEGYLCGSYVFSLIVSFKGVQMPSGQRLIWMANNSNNNSGSEKVRTIELFCIYIYLYFN